MSKKQKPRSDGKSSGSWRGRLHDPGLAIGSALLLVLSYPYFPTWWLVFIAFVPLLLIRGQELWHRFRMGWLQGFVFHLLALSWIRETIVNYSNLDWHLALAVLLLFAIVSAFLNALFLAGGTWLVQNAGLNRFVAYPLVYAGLDLLYPQVYPYYLGMTLYRQTALIQVVDLCGMLGLSYLVVMTNCLVVDLFRRAPRWRLELAVTALCWGLVGGYGWWNLEVKQRPEPRRLSFALVQPNVLIEDRFGRQNPGSAIYRRLLEHTVEAGQGKPDLVVWPEAAYPFVWREDSGDVAGLRELVRTLGVQLIVGMVEHEGRASYNGAVLLGTDGETRARYRKINLLVFGEYLPFEDEFPILSEWIRGGGHFKPGTDYTVADLGAGFRASIPICYEMIKPHLIREFVERGTNVLINLTNDVWFGRTKCPYQHLALCVFRAVEYRLPFLRATNTGISAHVDQDGRLLATTALFEPATLVGTVDVAPEFSLYREFGPWFELLVAVALVVALLRGVWRQRRLGRAENKA